MPNLIIFNVLLAILSAKAYLYKPIYFQEEEVRHVRAVTDQKPPCNEQKLIEILADSQISSPEDIIVITINDFDTACHAVARTIKKSDQLLKNCTESESLYYSLLDGLRVLDKDLCKNNEFYKKYAKCVKCYEDLGKDYESCNGTPDWNENEDEIKVCKAYKKIVNCYYIKTAKVCGLTAASYLRKLMKQVFDCTLLVKCSIGSAPQVKNPMSDKYVEEISDVAYQFIGNYLLIVMFVPFLLFYYSVIY
ncbi:uncharacterized protein LOC126737521 [Anthonomus grandis grandis]|uniref:uncharacterized protein LOC126737521 n=1 Tax=Anthonomus grandis grandis TaxID=2921223 RepID=UPI0021663EC6|nr:uncharacterized protein LOC126737521 [Anthonomus grandis grandis]